MTEQAGKGEATARNKVIRPLGDVYVLTQLLCLFWLVRNKIFTNHVIVRRYCRHYTSPANIAR